MYLWRLTVTSLSLLIPFASTVSLSWMFHLEGKARTSLPTPICKCQNLKTCSPSLNLNIWTTTRCNSEIHLVLSGYVFQGVSFNDLLTVNGNLQLRKQLVVFHHSPWTWSTSKLIIIMINGGLAGTELAHHPRVHAVADHIISISV